MIFARTEDERRRDNCMRADAASDASMQIMTAAAVGTAATPLPALVEALNFSPRHSRTMARKFEKRCHRQYEGFHIFPDAHCANEKEKELETRKEIVMGGKKEKEWEKGR